MGESVISSVMRCAVLPAGVAWRCSGAGVAVVATTGTVTTSCAWHVIEMASGCLQQQLFPGSCAKSRTQWGVVKLNGRGQLLRRTIEQVGRIVGQPGATVRWGTVLLMKLAAGLATATISFHPAWPGKLSSAY